MRRCAPTCFFNEEFIILFYEHCRFKVGNPLQAIGNRLVYDVGVAYGCR